MTFLVGLFTFVLIIICLMLILLVLVQLPKKDAGAGLAFGGGAADALFGAGSGNALTKITKWLTVVFLVLALLLGYAQDKVHSSTDTSDFAKQVQQKQMQTPTPPPAAQTPPPVKNPLVSIPVEAPNVPATTNAAK